MLSPTTANLLNAVALLALGLWGAISAGAFSGADVSPTVYIAPVLGLIFLLLHGGLRAQNKIISHIVPVLTLLQIFAFMMPLTKQSGIAQIRVGLIVLTGIIALIAYILFFVNARKERNS